VILLIRTSKDLCSHELFNFPAAEWAAYACVLFP